MKTPKFIVWTDHTANYNHKDKIKSLEANNVLEAMDETKKMTENDANLYCVLIYERIPKTNEYILILRSDNGSYWAHQKDSTKTIVRRKDQYGESFEVSELK